ncbi:hypothetical protein D3C87_1544580 [compost metagenome]
MGQDDPVDLTEAGTEDFLAWKSDRLFSFTVDEIGYEWGGAKITEDELRNVSGVAEDKDFVLERDDTPDHVLNEGAWVDLIERGAERLRTTRATTTIYINTEPHQVTGRRISFEALVGLAFNPPPSGPNILITIDYGKGPKQNPKGSLKAGQSVKIKNEMSFDVTATDRS